MELVEDTGVAAADRGVLRRAARPCRRTSARCAACPTDTNTNWHQDGAFLGRDVRSLNLWLALSPCGVDAPGLDIVPQRFDEILPTGTEGALFDWSVSPQVVEDAAGGPDAIMQPRVRARRRPAVRPHVPAPHRRQARHDAGAVGHRVVVLRPVELPGRADPPRLLTSGARTRRDE